MKAGHHGLSTSTGQAFVDAVDPEVAILSYGENNYGHPDAEVFQRLRDAGAELYSTYESGDIIVTATWDGYASPWDGDGEGDVSN